LLILGRILKPHGVLGEVTVAPVSDDPALFRRLEACWIGPPGGARRRVGVEGVRPHRRALLLKLAGVESPDAAAGLVGWELAIPRAEAPPLPDGSYYHADLLGMAVTEGDRALGAVAEILESPAHDVLVVRGEAGEWMLPATRAHIRGIDLAARRIDILPVAGLVEASGGSEARPEAL
jgi:16S rRNA processing protein RimM